MNEPSTTGQYYPKKEHVNERSPECKHNFFAVDKIERESATTIVCAWCGQVRQLKANGEVSVLKHKGTIRYEV